MKSVEELKMWKFEKGGGNKCWNDISKMHVVDNPNALKEKILEAPNWKSGNTMNINFKHRPGPTKMLDNFSPKVMNMNFANRPGPTNLAKNFNMVRRVNQQKGLNMFGDKDRDGVMNVLDCQPRNRRKQGPENNLVSQELQRRAALSSTQRYQNIKAAGAKFVPAFKAIGTGLTQLGKEFQGGMTQQQATQKVTEMFGQSPQEVPQYKYGHSPKVPLRPVLNNNDIKSKIW